VPLVERRRRQQSAKARDGLGALALATGDLSNAATHFHAALDIRQQLARGDPSGFDISIELAESCAGMAVLAKENGAVPEALRWNDRALDILKAALEQEHRHVVAQQNFRAASARRADLLAKLRSDRR